jgi:putative Holliday junction resolvase
MSSAPENTVPANHQSFLAFDYGLKRTGAEGDARFEHIAKRIKEWQPDALVIGVPTHPDGGEHENTLRARKFGRQLRGRFGLAVYEVDERYTTTEAHSYGAKDADAAAAAIILDQFLRSLP